MKKAAMAEAMRAFLALQGRTFPRIGRTGYYFQVDPDRFVAVVEVLDMTSSGLTVTVRFVDEVLRRRLGLDSFRVYRRGERHDGSGWYVPSYRLLRGEVSFASASSIEVPA